MLILIFYMLLMPPGVTTTPTTILSQVVVFKLPNLYGDEPITLSIPRGSEDEGIAIAIKMLEYMFPRHKFSISKETGMVTMTNPKNEKYYYFWIRGVQLQVRAATEIEAINKARRWFLLSN
jgi:hypothetical protein